MDSFTRNMIEQEMKPPLWARIYMRVRFGKDHRCDNCGFRTYWNGNVYPVEGIDTTLCDYCHSDFMG